MYVCMSVWHTYISTFAIFCLWNSFNRGTCLTWMILLFRYSFVGSPVAFGRNPKRRSCWPKRTTSSVESCMIERKIRQQKLWGKGKQVVLLMLNKDPYFMVYYKSLYNWLVFLSPKTTQPTRICSLLILLMVSKFPTTRDGAKNPVKNGICSISIGEFAGFSEPSTVWFLLWNFCWFKVPLLRWIVSL